METDPLVCDKCGASIPAIRDGVAYIDTVEAGRRKESATNFDKMLMANANEAGYLPWRTIAEIRRCTDSEPWRWVCRRCYLDSSKHYWVDGDRIDTHGKALDWTFHVCGKSWFDHVDWEDLVRRLHPDIPTA